MNGQKHGQGILRNQNDKIIYNGGFANDKKATKVVYKQAQKRHWS